MVFPFICVFVDKAIGYTEEREWTKEKCLYSELVVEILGRRWCGWGNFNEWMLSLRKHMRELKQRTGYLFEDH